MNELNYIILSNLINKFILIGIVKSHTLSIILYIINVLLILIIFILLDKSYYCYFIFIIFFLYYIFIHFCIVIIRFIEILVYEILHTNELDHTDFFL